MRENVFRGNRVIILTMMTASMLCFTGCLSPIVNGSYILENKDDLFDEKNNPYNSKIMKFVGKYFENIEDEGIREKYLLKLKNIFYELCEKLFKNEKFITQNNAENDFATFKNHYDICDDVWHGKTSYFWYNMYPIKANTYYEWTKAVDTLMTKLFIGSFIVGAIGGGIIYFGQESVVDFFGLILITILLFYDASFMVYSYNSCLHFDFCQNMQPEILIHLIDENGDGIDNYDGILTAKNLDAINECNGNSDDDTVWQTHYFTYELGPEDHISSDLENDFDKNGWYSLSNRYFMENIFEKAPCPPGKWEIKISSTSEWEGDTVIIDNVEGKSTSIIEVELEKDN